MKFYFLKNIKIQVMLVQSIHKKYIDKNCNVYGNSFRKLLVGCIYKSYTVSVYKNNQLNYY